VLAVVAAVLALPWPLAVLWYADSPDEGDLPLAVIMVLVVAAIVAAPFAARRRRFGALAGALWLLLLFIGFVGGLAGGLVVWPGAFLFVAAALPRPETEWRLGRVLGVAGGVVALCAAMVAIVLVVEDAREDPDLAVRLRPGASIPAFTERATADPHVTSVGSAFPSDDRASVELVQGLTPRMREDVAAGLRRSPDVVWVRIVD